MNPKPTNTMKHHEMLNKSTDVNFKKVMTRSSSKGSDAGMGIEEMDCGDEVGNSTAAKDGFVDGSKGVVGISGVVVEGVAVEKGDVEQNNGVKEGMDVEGTNGNVSDMFPELISTNISQGNIDKLPDIPVSFEHNPVLNPESTKNVGVKRSLDTNKASNVDVLGSRKVSIEDRDDVQGTKGCVTEIGESSNRNDAVMQNQGYGRASFARVLVEVDATKGIIDYVELWYRSLNRSMQLRVEYAWQPPICSHCVVFGHSFIGCNKRMLSEEEKSERNKAKGQDMPKSNGGNNCNEAWQSVQYKRAPKYVGEPMPTQPVHSNTSGVGTTRYGVNMGRGGHSFRGRGGFNGRGGYNGIHANNEKRYATNNRNEKDKENVGGEKQQQGKKKDVVVEGINESLIKHIAKSDFKTTNRYAVLENEGEEDLMNELQGIKVNIDVACEMGIPIGEEESKKWPEELQRYYEEKCVAMQKNEKKVLLQNKIKMLEKEIVTSNRGIELKSKKKAEEGVANEMESTAKVEQLGMCPN
ncbi:hypothetical protein CTI12_AA124890 [Artemisia annua]|uniref:Zinc knuckle CX2CX4HX4C n=1 Tax=Artemisia annua TaxID=35608 RepID=A0A2U1PQE3_ARTAN|nr:hypothetical protein CTI12_AA124890 [Artemisia annua]